MNVSNIMLKDPVTITIPNTQKEVLRKIISENVTGLPVIKRNGELAGLITRKNIFESPNEEQLALLMQWDIPRLKPTDTIEKAARTFVENSVYHLCVVRGKKLVGFLSPYELLPIVESRCSDRLVEEFLVNPCIPVWEGTPLRLLPKFIKITAYYAMPVLNIEGNLTGIITDRDLFSTSQIKEVITKSEVGVGLDDDNWSWEGVKNIMTLFYEEQNFAVQEGKIESVMIREPKTVYKGSSVAKAARLMRKNSFGQLPVTDNNDKLISMIHNVDILRALIE